MDNEENILQYTEISECNGILLGNITLPPGLVQYQLRGYDIGETPFSHVIPDSSVTFDSPQLDTVLIGNPVVFVNKGDKSLVRLSIQNKKKGPERLSVTISITTPFGIQHQYKSGQHINLTPQKRFEVEIYLTASHALLDGQVFDWIVNATESCSNKQFTTTFKGIVKPSVCGLPVNTGNCAGEYPRWFYNTTSKQCERFLYGGCGGNENKFGKLKECINKCGKYIKI